MASNQSIEYHQLALTHFNVGGFEQKWDQSRKITYNCTQTSEPELNATNNSANLK